MHREPGILWQFLKLIGRFVVAHGNKRMEMDAASAWHREAAGKIIGNWSLERERSFKLLCVCVCVCVCVCTHFVVLNGLFQLLSLCLQSFLS